MPVQPRIYTAQGLVSPGSYESTDRKNAASGYAGTNADSKVLQSHLPLNGYSVRDIFEEDAAGWAVYADAASVEPVDGSGGSPNITFVRSTTSPLEGTASGLFSKDASNRQGEGISRDFVIGAIDQGRIIQVSFEYQIASGTFVAGTASTASDVTIWVYDVTNARLVELSQNKLYSNVADRYNGYFQSAIDSTDYRLIIHIGSTSASAYEIKFDRINVGVAQTFTGPIVTEWKAFPSTATGTLITATTSDPAYGTVAQNVAYWRRVGDSMEIMWDYRQTVAGSAGSGSYLFNLPSGYSIDTGKLGASTTNAQSKVGDFEYHDGSSVASGYAAIYSATQLWMFAVFSNTGGSSVGIMSPWGSAVGGFGNPALAVSVKVTLPIAGWGSAITSALTGDDGRVIVAQYSIPAATAFTAATQMNFSTKVEDTHNAVAVGASWKFTAPISSWYEANLENFAVTSGTKYIELYKNGSQLSPRRIFMSANSAEYNGGTTKVYLEAGEYIDIRSHADGTTDQAVTVTINRIGGNAVAQMMTGAGRTAFTSTTTLYTSASTTWVECLSLAITPKYASSKICIRAILNLQFYTNDSIVVSARILKDGTPIATFTGVAGVGIGTAIAPTQATPIEWTEDAGSVAARTYTVEFRRESYAGSYGGDVYVNSGGSRTSTLKLVEEIE